mgnify:CR=1 FL=1
MSRKYSVKQLAQAAGVTIKTLHLYDKMDLLKPLMRTEAGYRTYGDSELLRLQQILFYRELDFPLKEIADILDDPDFDIVMSLEGQKKLLSDKKARLGTLLKTIDKTIYSLKNRTMLNVEELYEGLPPEQAAAYRKEAIKTYGKEVVERAEEHLMTLDKQDIARLVERQKELAVMLFGLKEDEPFGNKVQELIQEHYIVTRKLWGTHKAEDCQLETYKGLGMLYLTDERFTLVNNEYNKEFALFLSKAMAYYADEKLKQ